MVYWRSTSSIWIHETYYEPAQLLRMWKLESLNVTFDESIPKSRISPLVDDDVIEELVVQNHDRIQNLNYDLEEVMPRVYYLTAKQLQEQMDKEELIKKAEEKVRLLAISKPKVIKVVQEEAKNIGLDPRKIASGKAKKALKLRKHKFESYMWTINNKLKPETITNIKIYANTKPVVIIVYKGTDGRNFDVHRPFAFGEFGISDLDELREIIPTKKKAVVHDLINSLSQRYERIRRIPKELGIKSALPALEQASSQSSRKKRKHIELEPETKIPRLECNQPLPERVPFVNNMVIEEPEHGIFLTDEFGDQAFQRWSDIDKKLIAEDPDQEKLKSKKVKLEALGYEMN
ncbi:hypothetical protein Tco_0226225 [Tanacetum coccineum]